MLSGSVEIAPRLGKADAICDLVSSGATLAANHLREVETVLQTQAMLDAIERHAPGRPVLIGGDFNTSSFERGDKSDKAKVAHALALDSTRLVAPMAYEPMFDLVMPALGATRTGESDARTRARGRGAERRCQAGPRMRCCRRACRSRRYP